MRKLYFAMGSLMLAAALLTGAGCAEHRHGVYDPYYHDYHHWGPDEDRYYHDWYVRTYPGRGYRDYKHLNHEEQEQYWRSRHGR